MANTDSYVEIVNGSPVLKAGMLGTTVAAGLLGAYWRGLIALIVSIGSGINGAITDAERWLDNLVDELFGIGTDALATAWQSNAEFVSHFGPLSQVAVVVELVVVFWLLFTFGPAGLRVLLGAFR